MAWDWEDILANTVTALVFPVAAPIMLAHDAVKKLTESSSSSSSSGPSAAQIEAERQAALEAERQKRLGSERKKILKDTDDAIRSALAEAGFDRDAVSRWCCEFDRLTAFSSNVGDGDEAVLPKEWRALSSSREDRAGWARALQALAALGPTRPAIGAPLVSETQKIAQAHEEIQFLESLLKQFG